MIFKEQVQVEILLRWQLKEAIQTPPLFSLPVALATAPRMIHALSIQVTVSHHQRLKLCILWPDQPWRKPKTIQYLKQ